MTLLTRRHVEGEILNGSDFIKSDRGTSELSWDDINALEVRARESTEPLDERVRSAISFIAAFKIPSSDAYVRVAKMAIIAERERLSAKLRVLVEHAGFPDGNQGTIDAISTCLVEECIKELEEGESQ